MVPIVVSGVVSLSLTRLLCSGFLRPPNQQRHGWAYMKLENFFNGMLRIYDRSLGWALRHRLATMSIAAVILAVTVWQFVVMPQGFLPSEDAGMIIGFTMGEPCMSFEAMKE